MSARDDMILLLVACFFCFLVGALLGSLLNPRLETEEAETVYVVVGGNFSLPEGVSPESLVFANISFIESDGLIVVENPAMLEAFKGG